MGNLIVTGASIFVPLLNHLITVPYLYSPLVWGGIPWSAPSQVMLGVVRVILNIMLLTALATLSGMMTTERECQELQWSYSLQNAFWVLMGYGIGSIFATVMPVAKAPLLSLLVWMPYASWIVHGIIVAPFIMLFGAIGNGYQRHEVCHANPEGL